MVTSENRQIIPIYRSTRKCDNLDVSELSLKYQKYYKTSKRGNSIVTDSDDIINKIIEKRALNRSIHIKRERIMNEKLNFLKQHNLRKLKIISLRRD